MKIIVINNETKESKKILNIFDWNEISVFDYEDKYEVLDFNLVILTGRSNYSIFHRPNPYKKELELIRNYNKPIIGICLGSQLIAKAFWSSFWKLSDKLSKVIKIEFVKTNTDYDVYEAHRYYIKKLWKQLDGIARSSYWREIIKHKTKNIFWL